MEKIIKLLGLYTQIKNFNLQVNRTLQMLALPKLYTEQELVLNLFPVHECREELKP